MIQTSTQNDLIKYLYNETTEEESRIIESDILLSEELRELSNDFSSIMRSLDRATKQPSERAVENILEYSKFASFHAVR